MTSIESVEGEVSFENLPYASTPEQSKASDEALTHYQDPGPNSGLSRMRQEEVQTCASVPNLREVEKTNTLNQLCDRLISLIEKADPTQWEKDVLYASIANKLALHDPLLAKTVCDKIEYLEDGTFSAYITTAQNQSIHDAEITLNEAKQRLDCSYWVDIHSLLDIHQEEVRRGLPQAQSTLDLVLDDLETNIYKLNDGDDQEEFYDLVTQKLACLDPLRAKNLCDKMNDFGEKAVVAYIKISQTQSSHEAENILNEVKQQLGNPRWFNLLSFLNIHQEEARRGMPQAQNTLDLVLDNLENIHRHVLQYDDDSPVLNQFSLLKLLKCEARLDSPLLSETLTALWANTKQILQQEDADREEDFIDACCYILEVEASYPSLHSQLEKDFPHVLEQFTIYKGQCPSNEDPDHWEWILNWTLEYLIKDISHALSPTNLARLEKNVYLDAVQEKTAFWIAEGKNELSDKETVIQSLVTHFDTTGWWAFLDYFTDFQTIVGVEKGSPYLESARESILKTLEDNPSHEATLILNIMLLQLETALAFPEREATLSTVYSLIKEVDRPDHLLGQYQLESLIEAEFSLIGQSG